MRDDKIVFALDIGFGNVKAYGPAISPGGTGRAEPPREMQFHFPSIVVRAQSVTSEGTSALARFNGHRVAVGDEEYFVGEDAPRLTSQRQIVDMSRDYPTTPQYYALALGALHRDACDGNCAWHLRRAGTQVGPPRCCRSRWGSIPRHVTPLVRLDASSEEIALARWQSHHLQPDAERLAG